MSLENSLERIASALEAIAKSKSVEAPARTGATTTDQPKTEAPKTRPGKKAEEKPKLEESDFEGQGEGALEETAEVDNDSEPPKWADVNRELFAMLGEVREVEGRDAAKAVCAMLMKKYSGGKQFSETAVEPKLRNALRSAVKVELEALGG